MNRESSGLSDKEKVTEHIQQLEPALSEVIEYIRQTILNTDKEVGERIKWNNPSFFYTGEMKPFDPKSIKEKLLR